VLEPRDSGQILPDIRDEARRLTDAAIESGLPMRLMGGLAVWQLSPTVRRPPYARDYADMDFAAWSRAGRSNVGGFLERHGYVGEKLFNALHGAQRLIFGAPDGRWTIDVVFDELNMSHRIDLRGRLNRSAATLDPADLLLTKLQVWEINRKDLGDIVCLLADQPLVAKAGASPTPGSSPTAGGHVEEGASSRVEHGIDLGRVVELTSSDWGLCHTVERNLGRVRDQARDMPAEGSPFDPAAQATELLDAIAGAPKSLGWKARARVGERVRWYETPEDVRK
jgi:hypothetical protein